MKKNLLVICTVVAMMASCGTKQPAKPVFNNAVDSLSYSIAMARTNGFIDYLAGSMGVDTAYMADFVKGFIEGVATKEADGDAAKAYNAGVEIGKSELTNIFKQLNDELFGAESGKTLNRDNYISAFIAGATEDFNIMDRNRAGELADSLFEEVLAQANLERYANNIQNGKEYLEKVAKEDGVVALESGVLYKVIEQGNGEIPTETDRVNAKYEGRLIDGTVFDKSEEGIEFPVTGVIEGWREVLQLMPVGSKWQVYIPAELGYGSRAAGSIPPYSALTFDIELLDIVK